MVRTAYTLVELALILTLIGVVVAVVTPSIAHQITYWKVKAAVADVVNALVLAREAALARGVPAVFVVSPARGTIAVTCGGDTLAFRTPAETHGVTLTASNDTVRYAPNGLASGVSNLTLIIARGERVDSVVVSRLGRVRTTE